MHCAIRKIKSKFQKVSLMPIYEYRCPSCGRRGSKLQKMSDNTTPNCPNCGASMSRMVSRVGFLAGEDARMEKLSDPSAWGDFNEDDPKSLGKMMRKMGEEMGDDLGDDFREVVERLEGGDDPEAIERDLGGPGGDTGGGGNGGWLD